MAIKTALITGITGQVGSYLAELLLGKGYVVHGLMRRSSSFNTARIDHLYRDQHDENCRLYLHYGDLTDGVGLTTLLDKVQPAEIYHLGAQSHVKVSFESPIYTADTIAMGTLRLLEAVRLVCPASRFYQASSSEMFGGGLVGGMLTETSPFMPRSPYAAAKVMAHNCTTQYRDAYGLHASCGILFNHESPRRGETFVTRKITRAVGRILLGLQDTLYLGNMTASRDWGFAGDYAHAMWLMLQADEPDDFIIATGSSHTVRHFVEAAFTVAGLAWDKHVRYDKRYYRPLEVAYLRGDSSKARQQLGWEPSIDFDTLVAMMVDSDLTLAKREAAANAV